MKELIIAAEEYRTKLLNDAYKPTYHFTIHDCGIPGDSNGAFFADGVYHLMYLYKSSKTDAYHWGHVSSVDLVHWRHHEDALVADDGDEGCYSGGAFLDDDGTAYLTFWKFPSKDHKKDHGGIAIAYAKPPYEHWERLSPIVIEGHAERWGTMDIEINGAVEHISCADPSNIWKKDGFYYMQTGNLCVLNAFGREEDSDPHYQGDWTDLFRSKDLKTWEFVHRFYTNTHKDEDWPDKTEDDMCPSFLPLFDKKENGQPTDKWLQLFIAHNRGCQYYVGTLNKEIFTPEVHGRMSWKDKTYFAPEALIDNKNRHIIWTWLLDNPCDDFKKYGWSGVYGFPRTVWWENGELKMAPASELDLLQYNQHTPKLSDNNKVLVKNGDSFRIKATFDTKNQQKCGFNVRASEDGTSGIEIYYDTENKALVFDATKDAIDDFKTKEEAPLVLCENEMLSLDIFVDKSVIEVYANERQAICRRVYPKNPEAALNVELIGEKEALKKAAAWEIAPANPY